MQHRPLFFCLAALLAFSAGSTLRAQTDLIVGSNSTVSATNFSSGTNTYSNAVVGLQSGQQQQAQYHQHRLFVPEHVSLGRLQRQWKHPAHFQHRQGAE
jgi:hypothetical protein